MIVNTETPLVDLQASADTRDVALSAVGVSDIRTPITIRDPKEGHRQTVATVRMSVDVPATSRGAHLSRFIEVLNAYEGQLTLAEIGPFLARLRKRQGAGRASIEVDFAYFLEKAAPVSGARGLIDYRCAFLGEDVDGHQDLRLRVEVPVTTLCPCSKAISEAGAHNQRAVVTVELRSNEIVWIEEVVEWVEASGSCPLYPVLKRVDEKHVTERAYANPRFVEDVVRESMVRLRGDPRVRYVRIEAHSHESIHNHNAYARASWQKDESDTTGSIAGGERER